MTSIPSLPTTLAPALSGREAITDALYRFVLGLDNNDPNLFDSAFTPTATFAVNGKVSEGLPAIHADCFDLVGHLDTSHLITNVRVHIAESGGTAAATASVLAQHFLGGQGLEPAQPRLLAGAQYYAELVKEEASGLWKIAAFQMKASWAEGDWGVIHKQ
ncbi:nuclear transport factor 2 family protein [Aspergillus clavatus NRRL 1]|uniref:SnoaL-like domain-containing protein n=1 Tax=Aspergillus clavatus (strain ATCC 1007 / CBS 513.65 / DSM 816 / NCTC 3887 / NRRL 1 / QM 1276 / 107) TaxID=344612 RepID=A1CG66_ASPCL|nr:uncharacterized protein ACLA_065800 [Aspergillus clavatus NRRL 1]EAW10946.1 conserved hypothetical protein [Aspergillus clavatus NRRL 1]